MLPRLNKIKGIHPGTLLRWELKNRNLKSCELIFWDTNFNKIDWNKNKKAVIKRILERGNETEINEIIRFYGKKIISKEIKSIKKSHLPSFEKNIIEYNLI